MKIRGVSVTEGEKGEEYTFSSTEEAHGFVCGFSAGAGEYGAGSAEIILETDDPEDLDDDDAEVWREEFPKPLRTMRAGIASQGFGLRELSVNVSDAVALSVEKLSAPYTVHYDVCNGEDGYVVAAGYVESVETKAADQSVRGILVVNDERTKTFEFKSGAEASAFADGVNECAPAGTIMLLADDIGLFEGRYDGLIRKHIILSAPNGSDRPDTIRKPRY